MDAQWPFAAETLRNTPHVQFVHIKIRPIAALRLCVEVFTLKPYGLSGKMSIVCKYFTQATALFHQ